MTCTGALQGDSERHAIVQHPQHGVAVARDELLRDGVVALKNDVQNAQPATEQAADSVRGAGIVHGDHRCCGHNREHGFYYRGVLGFAGRARL